MKIISKAEFDAIDDGYKTEFRDVLGKRPEWRGRRAAFLPGEGTALSIEGVHFLVDGEYTHLPWLAKANAAEGCCYQFPGGYIQVTRLYRLSEEEALEKDLYSLDRVEYIQHAKWGSVPGGCALAGSDVREG